MTLLGPTAYGVDTDELSQASRALDEASQALEGAAARVHEVSSGRAAWAVDGSFPEATDRLLATLAWAATQARVAVGLVGGRLGAAAAGYLRAEQAAGQSRSTVRGHDDGASPGPPR